MGITIEDAIDNEIISSDLANIINTRCICGEQLQFNDNITRLECSNSDCKNIIIERAGKFCKINGIDIKKVSIANIINKLEIVSPYQLLLLPEAYENKMINNSSVSNIEKIVEDIRKIRDKEFELHEILGMCGIESIHKIAKRLASGYNSFNELYNEIEIGQVLFINEIMGIKSIDGMLIGTEIYNIMKNIKDELIFSETMLKIKGHNEKIIEIAFCDNVSPYNNVSELMDILNSIKGFRFKHVYHINENTDILVRNSGCNSSKVRAANQINNTSISEKINSGEIDIDDIGTIRENELKPLGHKIWISGIEEVIEKIRGFEDV